MFFCVLLFFGTSVVKALVTGNPQEYNLAVELAVALFVISLFIVGSLLPRKDLQPFQGGFVLFPDKKQPIKIIYRIWATWRVNFHTHALTQHFQVLKGNTRQYEIRKML